MEMGRKLLKTGKGVGGRRVQVWVGLSRRQHSRKGGRAHSQLQRSLQTSLPCELRVENRIPAGIQVYRPNLRTLP